MSLLAACGPQLDPREGRWQGTCSPDGRSPSEANVTMELELIDDLQSAGAALVDRGFGPEPGSARMVLHEDGPTWAVLVVEVEEAAWQMWQSLRPEWTDGEPTWGGSCWLSDDGEFEVLTDCSGGLVDGWIPLGGCDREDARWSGSADDILEFAHSFSYSNAGDALLTRDDAPLAPVVR